MKSEEGLARRPEGESQFAAAVKGVCFLMLILLFSCSDKQRDTFTNESVKQAAQHYYTLYIQGNAKEYVQGMADADSFTEDYAQQMQNVIAQAAKELERKGGVVRVEALSDTIYVADSTAYVYLDLVFADSVHEQIGVPMVFQKNKWRIK